MLTPHGPHLERSNPGGEGRERLEVPGIGSSWHRPADTITLVKYEISQSSRTGGPGRKTRGRAMDGSQRMDGWMDGWMDG